MIIVPGAGPIPSDVMIVGEAPGREEAHHNPPQPFVGKSGREQERYLSRHNLTPRAWRRNNVCQEYTEGNPEPNYDQLGFWTPFLVDEIRQCQPKLIIAVGAYAARWFLGESTSLSLVHGMPHHPGAYDPLVADRCPPNTCIIPIIHPAAGFYTDKNDSSKIDIRANIADDYSRVASIYKLIKSNKPIPYSHDEYAGHEIYLDVTGNDLELLLSSYGDDLTEIGLDTEGIPGSPWSIQVSPQPGIGWTLRYSQPDFSTGVSSLQHLADSNNVTFILHNAASPSGCMYDIRMCREMGLELRHAPLWDTMYAAYLLRLESQSLKTLAFRWCGMHMANYESIIGDIGREKQISYLKSILNRHSLNPFPKPEPRVISSNDGTSKLYKPNPVDKTVARILADIESNKVNKYGEPVDPYKRWQGVDDKLRSTVESTLGPIPIGTLNDIPLDRAIYYSSRDPDATLRVKHRLSIEHSRLGLTRLMSDGMQVLPILEEMQSTGMPANRHHFELLQQSLESDLDKIQARISHLYFNGRPFNPKSPQQVEILLRRRGLKGAKRTSTGRVSTGKKSIEHLRFKDPAMGDVFDWREKAHIRDTFCADVLRRIPPSEQIYIIHTQIKPTTVTTRRLATENPNLLAVPVRSDIGRKIREGYMFDDSTDTEEIFGAWDLSQIEMRFLAHESMSKFLCRKFIDGADVHDETARTVFGLHPDDKVDKFKHRIPAKTTNFGLVYGEQASGLHDQLRMLGLEGWDIKSCEKLIKEVMKLFGIGDYIKSVISKARVDGYVRDHWGMYRYLPQLYSDDPKLSAEAGRHAVSHRIQGGAQGMIQNSMRWLAPHIRQLQQSGLNIKWRLQIHDELIFSFDEWMWDLINPLVLEALTVHCGIKLRVPVLADGAMAKNWGDLK